MSVYKSVIRFVVGKYLDYDQADNLTSDIDDVIDNIIEMMESTGGGYY